MNSLLVSLVVFVCVFGGAMMGLYLRIKLPQPHLSGDSRDAVKIGMALVATMAGLCWGYSFRPQKLLMTPRVPS